MLRIGEAQLVVCSGFCLLMCIWLNVWFSAGRLALRTRGSYLGGRGRATLLGDSKAEKRLQGDGEMITPLAAAIATSVTTFAVTNIDDLFLLTLFFGRRVPMRRVVSGQCLGFAGIVSISLMGFGAALAVPRAGFRFLGVLPLAIGVKRLFQVHKSGRKVGRSSFGVLSIAAITVADGADNVGVYVPFFAASREYLWVILIVYAALLPVWCFGGKWLGERPVCFRLLDRHGHWIVPVLFIGLGLYILLSQSLPYYT